jgi:SAM-dependent methyltransferase
METGTGKTGSASIQRELWGARATDWADVQEGTVLPLYEAVLAKTAVGAETRLLDVGCGSGMFCRMAAKRGAKVSGIDATPALIDIAKSRLADADFRTGEMEALPYAEGAFHVVTGLNSFQYAGNPVNALGEAKRVAERDGFVVVAVWGKESDCQARAYLAAVGRLLPPPPPGAPGPFALSEEGALEALARRAGLSPIEVNDVDSPWVYRDLEMALTGLLSAGPAVKAMQVSGQSRVSEAVARALEPFATPSGGYRLENKFRYLIARA